MLDQARVMIVEDDVFTAADIALTVEQADGVVVGPVATVAEALAILSEVEIDAAILDCNLLDGDITPVAVRLQSAQIPVVICSGLGIPKELAELCPDIPTIIKPTRAAEVVSRLAEIMKSVPASDG
jgi:DNA-binding response OmpR family regulator